MFSYGLLHMDTLVLADQQKLTCISSVQTLDANKTISHEQWPIAMYGERESGESVLLVYFDDDDDNDALNFSMLWCR